MKETNEPKGKAGIKQDLENTLSFYNDALTRKVVGQLFDDYVKDDEELYYTRNIDNDYSDFDDYELNYENDDRGNEQNNNYYFGDDYFGNQSSENDDYFQSSSVGGKQSKSVNKNEYYEYDDFDDDFDQYDYEPPKKKKASKPKKVKKAKEPKISKSKRDKFDADFDLQYQNSRYRENDENNVEYNIMIKDLSVPPEDNLDYTSKLPPLKDKEIPQRELGYEDVLKYSPRRRGGRNQTTKKKKRVPLNQNKNIYPDGISKTTPKRKTVPQKSKIVIHNANPKPKKARVNKILLLLLLLMIAMLAYCFVQIKTLEGRLSEYESAPAQTEQVSQPIETEENQQG